MLDSHTSHNHRLDCVQDDFIQTLGKIYQVILTTDKGTVVTFEHIFDEGRITWKIQFYTLQREISFTIF